MRASTKAFSEEVQQRAKEDEEEKALRRKERKPRQKVRQWTQEEILREAKKTEIKNLKSLAEMKKLEEEKKRVVVNKVVIKGPKETFLSTYSGDFITYDDDALPAFLNEEPAPCTHSLPWLRSFIYGPVRSCTLGLL